MRIARPPISIACPPRAPSFASASRGGEVGAPPRPSLNRRAADTCVGACVTIATRLSMAVNRGFTGADITHAQKFRSSPRPQRSGALRQEVLVILLHGRRAGLFSHFREHSHLPALKVYACIPRPQWAFHRSRCLRCVARFLLMVGAAQRERHLFTWLPGLAQRYRLVFRSGRAV